MSNYSLLNYAQMMSDPLRMPAYIAALKRAIKPGDVVLDLGAGTGIFSLMACQLGASKVYAVETNAALELGPHLARDNNLQEKIVFINQDLLSCSLPEKVDLIIADLRGRLPYFAGNLELMKYAKEHCLKSTGRIIPERDKLYVAPCCDADLWKKSVCPWQKNKLAVNLDAFQNRLSNLPHTAKIQPEMLAAEPKLWSEINYQDIKQLSASAEVTYTNLTGPAYGLLVWFDAELYEDIGFSCGPGAQNEVYGSAFFPFIAPVELGNTEALKIKLSATKVEDDYVWRWQSSTLSSGEEKPLYDQSNFLGVSISELALKQQAETA